MTYCLKSMLYVVAIFINHWCVFFFITDQAKEKDLLYIQYVPGGMSFSRLTVSTPLFFLCQALWWAQHIISSSFPSSYSPVLLQLHLISQPCLSQAISPCLLFINSLLFSTPSLASLLSPPFFHLSPLCSFFFFLFLTVFFLWVDEELRVGGCTGVFLCGRLQIWKGHPLSLIQVNPGLLVLQDAACVTALQRQPEGRDKSHLHICMCVFMCACLPA